jgi:hypothetical protein
MEALFFGIDATYKEATCFVTFDFKLAALFA